MPGQAADAMTTGNVRARTPFSTSALKCFLIDISFRRAGGSSATQHPMEIYGRTFFVRQQGCKWCSLIGQVLSGSATG